MEYLTDNKVDRLRSIDQSEIIQFEIDKSSITEEDAKNHSINGIRSSHITHYTMEDAINEVYPGRGTYQTGRIESIDSFLREEKNPNKIYEEYIYGSISVGTDKNPTYNIDDEDMMIIEIAENGIVENTALKYMQTIMHDPRRRTDRVKVILKDTSEDEYLDITYMFDENDFTKINAVTKSRDMNSHEVTAERFDNDITEPVAFIQEDLYFIPRDILEEHQVTDFLRNNSKNLNFLEDKLQSRYYNNEKLKKDSPTIAAAIKGAETAIKELYDTKNLDRDITYMRLEVNINLIEEVAKELKRIENEENTIKAYNAIREIKNNFQNLEESINNSPLLEENHVIKTEIDKPIQIKLDNRKSYPEFIDQSIIDTINNRVKESLENNSHENKETEMDIS